MSLLSYDFMIRALLGALFTGLAAPAVGTYLVQRRLALMGDGIGHIAVTGVAVGLLTGSSPTITAVIVSLVEGRNTLASKPETGLEPVTPCLQGHSRCVMACRGVRDWLYAPSSPAKRAWLWRGVAWGMFALCLPLHRLPGSFETAGWLAQRPPHAGSASDHQAEKVAKHTRFGVQPWT